MKINKKDLIAYSLKVFALLILSVIISSAYSFFNNIKKLERDRINLLAKAQKAVITYQGEGNLDLAVSILNYNTTIPLIIINSEKKLFFQNLDEKKYENKQTLNKKIEQYTFLNNPIEILENGKVLATIYYGNSSVLNKLVYYPLGLVIILIILWLLFVFFYRSVRKSNENKLWISMARETAHQISTPLSSLLGWSELLKEKHFDSSILFEVNKDLNRLTDITGRFSKIGAVPHLGPLNIVQETKNAVDYMKSRIPNMIAFEFNSYKDYVLVNLDRTIYGWTLENIIKNAIDAMRGKGKITVSIIDAEDYIKVQIEDTGKGIPVSDLKNIFKTGFSTKKTGWGLGLSLVKRIVEDYHHGKVKILSSMLGKGTVIEMQFQKFTE